MKIEFSVEPNTLLSLERIANLLTQNAEIAGKLNEIKELIMSNQQTIADMKTDVATMAGQIDTLLTLATDEKAENDHQIATLTAEIERLTGLGVDPATLVELKADLTAQRDRLDAVATSIEAVGADTRPVADAGGGGTGGEVGPVTD